MTDPQFESPCFGTGWDGLKEVDCINCAGNAQCKDRFVNGTLRKYFEGEGNTGKSVEEIGKALSVSPESVTEAVNTLNEIMTDDDSTAIELKETEVIKAPKARRGRKAKDLVECPECDGAGYINGAECPICDGYGDISEKKLAAKQQSVEAKVVERTKEPVNSEAVTGNDLKASVGGGDSPSNSESGVLPLPEPEVSNPVFVSTGDSGRANEDNQNGENGQHDKTPELVRSPILSVERILSIVDQVNSFYLDSQNNEFRVTFRLKDQYRN